MAVFFRNFFLRKCFYLVIHLTPGSVFAYPMRIWTFDPPANVYIFCRLTLHGLSFSLCLLVYLFIGKSPSGCAANLQLHEYFIWLWLSSLRSNKLRVVAFQRFNKSVEKLHPCFSPVDMLRVIAHHRRFFSSKYNGIFYLSRVNHIFLTIMMCF